MRTKPSTVARILPSLTDVAFLMPLVFIFLRMGGAKKLLEGDTGWHIRTGQWILANHQVPRADFFSFSMPGQPWFAWEWGWDALFAWIYGFAGMKSVVFVCLLLLSVTFAILYRLVLRKSGNPVIAIAVTLLATATSAVHWWARPHLFTFVFTVIFYYLLERKRDGQSSPLWLLPILTVVWTNLHGGFIVGLLMLGCYAAGELVEAALAVGGDQRRAAVRRSLPYMAAGAGCVAATFVNPYTYHLHVHILEYLGNPQSPFFRWVGEWQSVSFHNMVGRYFEIMILLAVPSCIWSAIRRDFVYPFLVLGWMHLALESARHIPIFAFVAAPVIAQAAQGTLEMLKKANLAGWVRKVIETGDEITGELAAIDRVPRFHLISAAAVLVMGLAMFAPHPADRFLADYNTEKYPKEAVDALGAARLAGNVFTNDEWGDYLIYRLYPSTKVFVDGRFDFYGADFTEEYLNLIHAYGSDWEKTLKEYNVTSALLPAKDSLTTTLELSGRWKAVYKDDTAVLLREIAPQPAGQESSSITAGCGDSPCDQVTQSGDTGRQQQSERSKSL